MKVYPLIAYALSVLLLFTACGDKEKATERPASTIPTLITTEEVRVVFSHYVSGDYEGYVNCMQSCDNKPADYKRQMATLYKQHAADQRKDDGDITNFQVTRVLAQGDGNAAEAFIAVTYAGGKSEEILLQFIYTNGEWRLR